MRNAYVYFVEGVFCMFQEREGGYYNFPHNKKTGSCILEMFTVEQNEVMLHCKILKGGLAGTPRLSSMKPMSCSDRKGLYLKIMKIMFQSEIKKKWF